MANPNVDIVKVVRFTGTTGKSYRTEKDARDLGDTVVSSAAWYVFRNRVNGCTFGNRYETHEQAEVALNG